ncbi:hypothetical protein [Sphingopyxis sp. PET50]|uniref:hypothetical protein n=1 Tax=Sphingopyxis sp. PET50 TaxID=2976533 RepID=UPI0021AE80ED|nr:hypothetical protein [Sphingopyxis sp. PET50]
MRCRTDKPVSITLMRPDVDVGELQGGGLPQPNADWTDAARKEITAALRAKLQARNIDFVMMEDRLAETEAARVAALGKAQEALAACRAAPVPLPAAAASAGVETAMVAEAAAAAEVPAPVAPDCSAEQNALATAEAAPDGKVHANLVADYEGLHSAVVGAIIAHKYGLAGGKLPTKKEDFAYTLGPGTADLGKLSGANYGLFVMTYDQFASDSRKAMQVMGALGCLIGACIIVSGGQHVAYVSLVELDTGNIVWFNLLRGSKGDVREAEGAGTMIDAIMAGMPSRPGEKTAPATDLAAK